MNKLWGWAFILAISAATYGFFPEFFHQTYGYLKHGDIQHLAIYLQSFGLWSVAVILLLFVVMTFTIVFPFMILSGAAGIMYGIVLGILVSWAGEVLGAIVMFFVARYLLRHCAERWICSSPYLKQVDDYSAANGFKALLIARLLPLAPSGIITAVAAISRISFRDFMWATVLGKLPPVVIKVVMGYDLVFIQENPLRLVALALLVVAIYGVVWWRKRSRPAAEEPVSASNTFSCPIPPDSRKDG
ncbi:MAG TPA: TVP38/TMEM64 family protein [Patescibacteria group bacterium]|nr:TVP38/TMEM64 family protein [Patescibacteria group bacterium]